ncbi:unnamed protein product [Ambrosiozyma monospora]|uniref:Unnamed protein product n=1 Tax=Ambrosiozyma monospora TaxID=43982 RepID=A0A9W6YWR5_AMBMO|nr:unnamed protein product [Ambrosiozyma monospora]
MCLISSSPVDFHRAIHLLLRDGCHSFDAYYQSLEDLDNPTYLAYATSLTCTPLFLNNISGMIKLSGMKRLTKLRLVIDVVESDGVDEFRRIARQVKSWESSAAVNNQQRRVILSIQFKGPFNEAEGEDIDYFSSVVIKWAERDKYEIEIDPNSFSLESYPSVDDFAEFIEKKLADIWVFQARINDHTLKFFEEVNAQKNLKALYLKFFYSKQHDRKKITFSNPTIETVVLDSFRAVNYYIHFQNMFSLKQLCLKECGITWDLLSTLPETLNQLSLINVDVLDSSPPFVSLPIHLQTLIISSGKSYLTTFQISNINQLVDLNEVSLLLDNLPCSNARLKPFIHSFSKRVNRLQLKFVRIYCEETDDEDYDDDDDNDKNLKLDFSVSGLSLNELHPIKDFSFSYFLYDLFNRPTHYNLCDLPLCSHLELGVIPSLSGEFSKTLESLTIKLSNDNDNLRQFWKKYITPLENLRVFKVSIIEIGHLDFRGLKFNKHLHTVELISPEKNITNVRFPLMLFLFH